MLASRWIPSLWDKALLLKRIIILCLCPFSIRNWGDVAAALFYFSTLLSFIANMRAKAGAIGPVKSVPTKQLISSLYSSDLNSQCITNAKPQLLSHGWWWFHLKYPTLHTRNECFRNDSSNWHQHLNPSNNSCIISIRNPLKKVEIGICAL